MDINGHWQLFDYLDPHGQNVMQAWSMDLSVKERARLDLRIDVLERSGDKLSYKLITQTSGRYRQRSIWEIPMKGQVALRPMLCRGPFDMRTEFTFVYGAVERDNTYVPIDAPKRANTNRLDLIKRGEIGRENHKRFGR